MTEPKADQPASSTSSPPPPREAPAGPAPKKLTAKQQAVYDLKMAGKTRAEISAACGISQPVVSKYLQACYRKLGFKKGKRPNTDTVEYRDPERAAAIIDAATEPEAKLESLSQAFRDAGLPPVASLALLRRIRQKYFGAVEATKSLKSGEIVDALNHRIDLALRYMDDKTMAEASFRDLALGTTAMIEKRQLLRGEPTQIISDAERKKIHELAPLLLAEVKRRGLIVEGQVTEKIIEPA